MHFIYDIYLIFSLSGRELDSFPEFSDVVHSSIGSSVDLDDVQRFSVLNVLANFTLAAGFSVFLPQAIDSFSEETSDSCFSGAPGPGEKIRVAYAVTFNSILESLDNVFLSNDFFKNLRPVFSV
jgi:hypothetical protein